MMRLAVLIACGALVAPSAGLAAGQSGGEAVKASNAPKSIKEKSKMDRLVCKIQDQKGSRLGGKRVCRTQAEWDEAAYQQRLEFERKMHVAPAR